MVLERAASGLFSVFRRLVPYRGPEVQQPLVQSLQLLLRIDPQAVWDMGDALGTELAETLRSCAGHLHSPQAWSVLERLGAAAARHPRASDALLEALAGVIKGQGRQEQSAGGQELPSMVSLSSYSALLGLLQAFLEQATEDAARSGYIMELLECLAAWLTSQGPQHQRQGQGAEPSVEMCWLSTVEVLTPMCRHPDSRLRQASCLLLIQVLQASEALHLPWPMWEQCFAARLLPLAAELLGPHAKPQHKPMFSRIAAGLSRRPAQEPPEGDRTMQLAVSLLTKVILQLAARAADESPQEQQQQQHEGAATLGRTWLRALALLEQSYAQGDEEVQVGCSERAHFRCISSCRSSTPSQWAHKERSPRRIRLPQELVPEAVRTVLLFLLSQGLLTTAWVLPASPEEEAPTSVWDSTWTVGRRISSGLQPDLLLREIS